MCMCDVSVKTSSSCWFEMKHSFFGRLHNLLQYVEPFRLRPLYKSLTDAKRTTATGADWRRRGLRLTRTVTHSGLVTARGRTSSNLVSGSLVNPRGLVTNSVVIPRGLVTSSLVTPRGQLLAI